jgi:hypothetical protein
MLERFSNLTKTNLKRTRVLVAQKILTTHGAVTHDRLYLSIGSKYFCSREREVKKLRVFCCCLAVCSFTMPLFSGELAVADPWETVISIENNFFQHYKLVLHENGFCRTALRFSVESSICREPKC